MKPGLFAPFTLALSGSALLLALLFCTPTGSGYGPLALAAERFAPSEQDAAAQTLSSAAITSSSPTRLGQSTLFTISVQSSSPYTATWDFGDSSAPKTISGSPLTITHDYLFASVYTATATISDGSTIFTVTTRVTVTAPNTLLPLLLRSPYPGAVRLSVAQGQLEANRSKTTVVSATVLNNGTPLADYPVLFRTSLGSLTESSVSTNAEGVAVTRLSADAVVGRALLQAEADPLSATATVDFVAAACNDIENNDLPSQARDLQSLSAVCQGSLQDDPQDEDDYYRVTIPSAGKLTIVLNGIPEGADYNLQLVDSTGLQALAQSTAPGSQPDTISLRVQAEKYYIRIYQKLKAPAPTENRYTLTVLLDQ